MAAAFPQQTRSFVPQPANRDSGLTSCRCRIFATLNRELRDPDLSLIVTRPSQLAPWRMLMRSLVRPPRLVRAYPHFGPALAPHLLRLPVTAPIAVIDTERLPVHQSRRPVPAGALQILFQARAAAGPLAAVHQDRASRAADPALPPQSRLRHHIDKLRPISLGLPPRRRDLPRPSSTRRRTSSSPAASKARRPSARRGMREIVALRERGLRIDIAEGRLPPQEFYRRCAQAWIVWSPEGLGWDCFRHYEALGCGSVPLINQPTIERHRPLINGVHALYYDPEPGFLTAGDRSGARRQGPPAGDRARWQGACACPPHADGDRATTWSRPRWALS